MSKSSQALDAVRSAGKCWPALLLYASCLVSACVRADTTNLIPTLEIKANQIAAKVSPLLYGLMTEEINYSYEGGLYGELVRNRSLKANPTNAVYWNTAGDASISLDTNQPLNEVLDVSLKVDATRASEQSP